MYAVKKIEHFLETSQQLHSIDRIDYQKFVKENLKVDQLRLEQNQKIKCNEINIVI